MIINHNIAALNASIQLTKNQNATQSSLQKLSSGLRINSAADDAAGLAISEKMQGQIRGLDQATRNSQDAISLVQTAEGSLNETQDILQRMRELAVQAGNDSNTTSDRSQIQQELDQLSSEVNRIGNTTQFNTQDLLKGGTAVGTIGTPNEVNATGATAAIQGVTFTAKAGGSAGNSYSVQFLSGVANQSLGVSVNTSTNQITVQLATNGTGAATAADTQAAIVNAIQNNADASKLVSVSAGTPAAAVTGMGAATSLAGGTVGSGSFQLTNNFAAGDTIEINGHQYTAVSGTANKANGEFQVGAGVSATAANLLQTISADDATVNGAASTSSVSGTIHLVQTNAAAATIATPFSVGDPAHDLQLTFQIGANTGQSFTADFTDSRSKALGITTTNDTLAKSVQVSGKTYNVAWNTTQSVTNGTDKTNVEYSLNVSTHDNATAAVQVIDDAINTVSTQRAKFGAYENRLTHTVNNLTASSQNLTSASSRITDVNMASEMANFTKNNILSQAAQAMLYQANQLPQGVLQILR